jgi:hypothetical protein
VAGFLFARTSVRTISKQVIWGPSRRLQAQEVRLLLPPPLFQNFSGHMLATHSFAGDPEPWLRTITHYSLSCSYRELVQRVPQQGLACDSGNIHWDCGSLGLRRSLLLGCFTWAVINWVWSWWSPHWSPTDLKIHDHICLWSQ